MKNKKRFLTLVLALAALVPAFAVLNEKDLAQTLSVLRYELRSAWLASVSLELWFAVVSSASLKLWRSASSSEYPGSYGFISLICSLPSCL